MRTCIFPILKITFFAFFSSYCLPALAAEKANLTVEETIASVYASTMPVRIYRHANPEAMSEVRHIIEESIEKDRGFSRGMGALLGFHGGDADADMLLSVVKMQEGRTDSGQIMEIALASLGLMAHRGVERAREILSEMTDKSFWASLNVKALPDELYRQFPDLYTVNAARARYLVEFYKGVPLSSVKEFMQQMYPQHLENETAVSRFTYQLAIARKSVVSLGTTATDVEPFSLDADTREHLKNIYDRRVVGSETGEGDTIERVAQRRPPETAEEMMIVVIRPNAGESTETETLYAALAREAASVFQDFFVTNIKHGDYDALKGRILDDGRPQKARWVEKHWPDIRAELERTQGKVFSTLQSQNLGPDPDQYTAGEAEDGSYVVKMPIPNTRSIVEENWPVSGREAQLLVDTFAIAENFDLVLVMRKIDGKWFWNPFGW